MKTFHDRCVRELCLKLCSIFGYSVNILIREAYKRSGLEKGKVAGILRFLKGTCVRVEEYGEPKEYDKQDAVRFVLEFFNATEDILGKEGTKVLVQVLGSHLKKAFGEELEKGLIFIFGELAEIEIERSDVTKVIIRPKVSLEKIPKALGVPYPALLILAADYGKFKLIEVRREGDKIIVVGGPAGIRTPDHRIMSPAL